MGQYHAFCNIDKGEALYSHGFDEGLKLLEQGCGGYGGTTTALAMFLAPNFGRWNGDRIVILGDYAEVGDIPAGLPFADDPSVLYGLSKVYADEDSTEAIDCPCNEFGRNLIGEAFSIAYEGGWSDHARQLDHARLIPMVENTEDDSTFGPLYIVNTDNGQYLDPMVFGCGRNLAAIALRQCGVMLATVVLLATSNGRGGGDLRCDGDPDEGLVGSWGAQRVAIGAKPEGGTDMTARVAGLLERTEGRFVTEEWGTAAPEWLVKAASEAAPA